MIAYTGRFGSGKTYDMTRTLFLAKKKGYKIVTNYTTTFSDIVLLDFDEFVNFLLFLYEKLAFGEYERRPILIGLDEAGIYFNNRNFKNFPEQLYDFILQLRKLYVEVYYTVQNPSFVDINFRRLTFEYIQHKKIPLLPMFVRGIWELNPDNPSYIENNGNIYIGQKELFIFRKKVYKKYNTHEVLIKSPKNTIKQKFDKWENLIFDTKPETIDQKERHAFLVKPLSNTNL